jgi:hypothetical protein
MYPHTRQSGMTAIGWLLVLILIGFAALITLRLVPVYVEYMKVSAAMESVRKQPDVTRQPEKEIREMLQKRFDVEDVRSITARQVDIKHDTNGWRLSMEYTRQEPFVANIDLLVKFHKDVKVTAN